ncbi:DUF4124 domain-containing protein [Teredinibacter sp. KSP-S5-2]|uniref:DUF4124 domain-containing protein n=1 Tax=Teredinibacter sp. KSP-S5-2 TaxID=3034506 RepID=UPI0029345286|nr:DUF4124 domain-containing protein [Teredinibacter sp. KSP-S5-2]WNO09875.1 DUF4124 domain-containing protein [Teredinibacter sp. KSP-S5-2]
MNYNKKSTMLKPLLFATALTVTTVAFVSSVSAAEYYRWQDEDGTQHYGSTPPQGVKAERIKVSGGKPSPAPSTSSSSSKTKPPETPPAVQLTPEQIAIQKEKCQVERDRVAALKKGGRIRMEADDGSTKYLTQQEIDSEISISEKVINDTCKGI